MKNEKLYFISWIRAFSTICIVLCHLCSSSSIGWIIPFGQVFNIGVQIFFFISAFCFGYQGNIINVKEWYLKRLRRIICPYWIFLLIIYGVYFVTNQKISYINLLSSWIIHEQLKLLMVCNYFCICFKYVLFYKIQSKKGRLILSIYKEHFETVKVQRFCYSSCFNSKMCSKVS